MKSNVWIVTIMAMEVDAKFLTVTVAVEVKRRAGLQVILKRENTQELTIPWADGPVGWRDRGKSISYICSGFDNWKKECHSLRLRIYIFIFSLLWGSGE